MLVSNGVENNPTLLLMHEYMMTVSQALLGSVMELYRGLDLDQLLSQEGLFSDMMMMMCSSVKPHKKNSQSHIRTPSQTKGLNPLRIRFTDLILILEDPFHSLRFVCEESWCVLNLNLTPNPHLKISKSTFFHECNIPKIRSD